VSDLDAPVHISKIQPGDVLRLAMKAGHHLMPVPSPKGQQPRLQRTSVARATPPFGRVTFHAFVTANDPSTGTLSLQVGHPTRANRTLYAATVYYKDIGVVQKYITPAKEPRPVPISGGPDAIRRPGAQAFGLPGVGVPGGAAPGFARLIRVRF